MVAFADTSFVATLYFKESTSAQARAAIQAAPVGLPLTALAALELRNAFNRAVQRRRIWSVFGLTSISSSPTPPTYIRRHISRLGPHTSWFRTWGRPSADASFQTNKRTIPTEC